MRGEYVKAIQFYEESLQISMSQKGKESKKETALTLNRLGSLTRELGRYEEVRDHNHTAYVFISFSPFELNILPLIYFEGDGLSSKGITPTTVY